MAHVITFLTKRFDPAKETPNAINPIAGESVLSWLRQELKTKGFELNKPEAEDWGWYSGVEHGGATYLIGASGEPEDGNLEVSWTIQIDKSRSLKDKLFGRNKLTSDDGVSNAIESLIRSQSDFRAIAVNRD